MESSILVEVAKATLDKPRSKKRKRLDPRLSNKEKTNIRKKNNRDAAQDLRNRKKNYEVGLENKLKVLETERESLTKRFDQLEANTSTLRKEIQMCHQLLQVCNNQDGSPILHQPQDVDMQAVMRFLSQTCDESSGLQHILQQLQENSATSGQEQQQQQQQRISSVDTDDTMSVASSTTSMSETDHMVPKSPSGYEPTSADESCTKKMETFTESAALPDTPLQSDFHSLLPTLMCLFLQLQMTLQTSCTPEAATKLSLMSEILSHVKTGSTTRSSSNILPQTTSQSMSTRESLSWILTGVLGGLAKCTTRNNKSKSSSRATV